MEEIRLKYNTHTKLTHIKNDTAFFPFYRHFIHYICNEIIHVTMNQRILYHKNIHVFNIYTNENHWSAFKKALLFFIYTSTVLSIN